jgi:hypothetical protein
MTTEEFVENIYIEMQNYIKAAFDNTDRPMYVNEKIKELRLNKNNEEKFKKIISGVIIDVMFTLLSGFDGATSFGNLKQQGYKIFDEENNLVYTPGDLEAEAYEYFHENKYEKKNDARDNEDDQ